MKPVTLEVLTAPACAHCHAFLEYWKSIAQDWPNVTMRELSVITPDGQDMAGTYRIFSSPGIILNNELFATGGVNHEKFLLQLRSLSE